MKFLEECESGQYVGCFYDYLNGTRDLNGGAAYNESAPVTILSCVNFCSKMGFKYAGLQFGYKKQTTLTLIYT